VVTKDMEFMDSVDFDPVGALVEAKANKRMKRE